MKKCNVIFLASVACAFGVWAGTTSTDDAKLAVRGWNRLNASAFGSLGSVQGVTAETNAAGNVLWYVVKMSGGAAIVAPDDRIEPVVAVLPKSDGVIPEEHPLRAMLTLDMANRLAALGGTQSGGLKLSASAAAVSAEKTKWAKLKKLGNPLALSPALDEQGNPATIVRWLDGWNSDKKVGNVQTLRFWNQNSSSSYFTNDSIFDLYTPGNSPCGCVATAGASVMHYFRVPSGNKITRKCAFNGSDDWSLTTKGGTYDWSLIDNLSLARGTPLELSDDAADLLGRVAYDCGVGCKMSYTTSSSGSNTSRLGSSFRDVFNVKSVQLVTKTGSASGPNTEEGDIGTNNYPKIIYNQIRAGAPVVMGILDHEVVACGYGYDADKTDYTYVFLGWGGQNDAWYALPKIDTKSTAEGGWYTSTFIDELLTEIAPTNDQYVAVVGRLVDEDGNPVAGGTLKMGNGETLTTDANGYWGTRVSPDDPCYVEDSYGEQHEYVLDATIVKGLMSGKGGAEAKKLANALPDAMEITLMDPTVRVGGIRLYGALSRALENVNDGETVEIFKPTVLRHPVTVTSSCTIISTIEDASSNLVERVDDAGLTIAGGASVVLSNVVFSVSTNTTLATVQAGGCLTFDDGVDFGVVTNKGVAAIETADAGGFVLAGVPSEAFLLRCAAAKKEPAVFGSYTCDGIVAEDAAKKILCADDEWRETFGHADGGALSWLVETVPVDDAGGYFVGEDGTTNAYARIDRAIEMFEAAENATNLVLCKSGSISRKMSITRPVVISGADGVKITPTGDAAFAVAAGGDLTLTNIVFRDFMPQKGKGFIEVDGGALTLEKGAKIANVTGRIDYRSGVIDVLAGTMTMRPDAEISGCEAIGADYGTGYGGGIYVRGDGCVLNIEGGKISDCHASVQGGGVYAACSNNVAGISIKGPVTISGNTSVDNYNYDVSDDVYVDRDSVLPSFALTGELVGKVGIRYPISEQTEGNKEGDAFMTNAVGTVSRAVLDCLFNDTDDTLEAATNEVGLLVWQKKPDDGTCDPDEASAHVIYQDGTTNHYVSLARAVAYMTNSTTARIEMYKAGQMSETNKTSFAFPAGCTLTLTSRGDAYAFDRDKSAGIMIPATTSLTLTNVVFTRTQADSAVGNVTNALFAVRGGSLTLADGACISNILGNASRDANAITVSEGGTVTTLPGSRLVRCSNYYNYKQQSDSGFEQEVYGVGGGILADNGTAYLHGGEITKCLAAQGGGVYACNGALVFVSGSMRITDNKWLGSDGEQKAGNVYVADQSMLVLDGELTDKVGTGHTLAWTGDTNVAARVGYDWTANVDSLTNSAVHFIHDITSESGAAVTNGTEALIVWRGAAKGGAYTNLAGKVYALAGEFPTAKKAGLLPTLTDASAVSAELAKLGDESVAEKITTLEEYNDFASWAANVEGGKDAVAASDKAYVSYEFGTTNLFENAPVVEITEVTSADGELTLSVIVKDGEDAMAVASAKVAKLFEGTSDVGDWTSAGKKLDLTADGVTTDLTVATEKKVEFTIKPTGNPTKAFIRLRY